MAQSVFAARIARQFDIGSFLFALTGYLDQNCSDSALSRRGSVVVEELVVNAFWHGAAETFGGVGVELAVEGPGLRGRVWHDGAPFDPTAASPEDCDSARGFRDNETQGCGLRIVRAFTRSLVHSRSGDTNHVRFEIASE